MENKLIIWAWHYPVTVQREPEAYILLLKKTME